MDFCLRRKSVIDPLGITSLEIYVQTFEQRLAPWVDPGMGKLDACNGEKMHTTAKLAKEKRNKISGYKLYRPWQQNC